MEIYGTIGPSCRDEQILEEMFRAGMTGARMNLSHTSLESASEEIAAFHRAAKKAGVKERLLIDMQGPELRIGQLKQPLLLSPETVCTGIPLPGTVLRILEPGMKLLFDDGKLQLECISCKEGHSPSFYVLRGGLLKSGKSVAVAGYNVTGPSVTEQDFKNLQKALDFGVTDIMQPFARNRKDLQEVRGAMRRAGCEKIRLLAKIENQDGLSHLSELIDEADEIVIARGDLGNAMPLWELPGIQKKIAAACCRKNRAFMVVTQMLSSMEHSQVPTRAEVSDIYNAIFDGASSVMVTGETAVGEYPVDVVRYLAATAGEAWRDLHEIEKDSV